MTARCGSSICLAKQIPGKLVSRDFSPCDQGGQRRRASACPAAASSDLPPFSSAPQGALSLTSVHPWRIMDRLLGISGALALALLLIQIGHAGEPVWCYQVRRGDTLAAIARRFGASMQEMRGLNRLAPKAIPSVQSILVLPNVRDLRRGRLDLSRPPMVATPRRLNRESAAATRDRLSRLRDLAMVERLQRRGLLVPVPSETPTYYVAGVEARLRVARPWTRRFIEQLGHAFQDLFAQPLRITSSPPSSLQR